MRVHLTLQKIKFRPDTLHLKVFTLNLQLIHIINQRVDPRGHPVEVMNQTADLITPLVDPDQLKLLVGYLLHMSGQPLYPVIIRSQHHIDKS
ncbi:hypothetical protein D3C75_1193530 [compost metagenome]